MSFTAVTTTTIHVPVFYRDVCGNARKHGHDDIRFYVIGDYKTPAETADYLASLSRETGYAFEYFDVDRQKAYLADKPELDGLLPYNWGGRKMLANYIAYSEGAARLIMLDDDNFVGDADFFGFHKQTGEQVSMPTVTSESGWFNVYHAIVEKSGVPLYPRSYPWKQRFLDEAAAPLKPGSGRLGVINGFVLEDLDIDAIARLFWKIRVVGVKQDYRPNFALTPGIWTSWNNQNTAVSRDVAGAYFTPASTGRNADIWSAFVICKLSDATGDLVGFGEPVVTQRRNPHNLWRDLDDELLNNKATDPFVEHLRSIPVISTSHNEAMTEMITGGLKLAEDLGIDADQRGMILDYWRE